MLNKIDLIVFDMAGTTVLDQREVEKCFFESIAITSLDATREEINGMMGWSKIAVFETLWRKKLKGTSDIEIKKMTDESYGFFKSILEKHYLENNVFPTSGTLELFDFLKTKNIKIALGTGFYRSVTDIILKKLGWMEGLDKDYAGEGLINASVSSDQVEKGRPSPYMIFRAMELCGVKDVRKVIKIGDTPSDLGEGKNAGCLYSFGITNGTHTKSELEIYENDGLFSDMNCFRQFLEDS
ncbi:MAG: Haloacid dehalogenase domain protein hydrolase [Bacteroidetes bacterium]|nr:Haloacid dehalogenase domain protein hydrolase [Bacteroidota bacterium]